MIGPDYERPLTAIADGWLAAETAGIAREAEPIGPWWEAFGDPVLSELIVAAYRGNPTLEAAGVRVLEAQARRGIAVGGLFPQTQEAVGGYTRVLQSANGPVTPDDRGFDRFLLGFDMVWEIDVWGALRRGIEAADAEILAAVADYEDVLVSLLAETALTYVGIRTVQHELAVARQNAELQRQNFRIAELRAREGAASELDPAQAATLLYATEARIPRLEARLVELSSTLSLLLGVPPRRVEELVGARPQPIPAAPPEVTVGLPADLLRRRPDVRRAEGRLAAQSAQIGIAKADLLPRFSLVGSINLDAEDAKNFFEGRSFEGFGGPTFRWAVLNYGRIANNIRVQDARYQALVSEYEQSVLRAQAEVETALAAYRSARQRAQTLAASAAAAAKAVEIVSLQYREGAIDFTAVLLAQDFLLEQQSQHVASQGEVAAQLVALYKALGGGWEPWSGGVIRAETATQMQARTRWGGLLAPHRIAPEDGTAAPEKDAR